MKAVVAAFNQEKALVGAFSVITNLRIELFEVLLAGHNSCLLPENTHQIFYFTEVRGLGDHLENTGLKYSQRYLLYSSIRFSAYADRRRSIRFL